MIATHAHILPLTAGFCIFAIVTGSLVVINAFFSYQHYSKHVKWILTSFFLALGDSNDYFGVDKDLNFGSGTFVSDA